MSQPQPPAPAKLFIGLIVHAKDRASAVTEALTDAFGPVDLISPWLPFNFTDYYKTEMGSPLYRRIFAFIPLIDQAALVDIKLATNELEKRWSKNEKRQINLDPGFVLAERLVLATGKNFAHRIYLDKGIYADLTLVFRKDRFRVLPWTYPGYRQPGMQAFFINVRSKYIHDLKQRSTPCGATSNDS